MTRYHRQCNAPDFRLPATHAALMAASAQQCCTSFSIRSKASTDNILPITKAHPNWLAYADVFENPPLRLASRRPIWSDVTSVNTITQWIEDWSSAVVVTDATIQQPGFDLIRHICSLMNRFWTGQGPCRANFTNGVSPNHLPVIVASDRQ